MIFSTIASLVLIPLLIAFLYIPEEAEDKSEDQHEIGNILKPQVSYCMTAKRPSYQKEKDCRSNKCLHKNLPVYYN